MRTFNRTSMLICSVILMTGCATRHMANLRDCGRFSVGYGIGLGTDVGVGALTHPSLGVAALTRRVGFEDRYVYGSWRHLEIYYPMLMFQDHFDGLPNSPEYSYVSSFSDLNTDPNRAGTKEGCWFNSGDDIYPKKPFLLRATDIEVGVTLFCVSFRVGVNPLGIMNFLLGFVGLDVDRSDDDRQRATHGP